MQKEKGFIKYIVIIIVILAIVFLSQQPYFREIGKNLFAKGSAAISGYMAKGANWVNSTVLSKVSGEVANREGIIKSEVNQEKQNVSENIGKKISNYFSGVENSILHPGTTKTCAPATSSTSAK